MAHPLLCRPTPPPPPVPHLTLSSTHLHPQLLDSLVQPVQGLLAVPRGLHTLLHRGLHLLTLGWAAEQSGGQGEERQGYSSPTGHRLSWPSSLLRGASRQVSTVWPGKPVLLGQACRWQRKPGAHSRMEICPGGLGAGQPGFTPRTERGKPCGTKP